jgi:hypothetical protein
MIVETVSSVGSRRMLGVLLRGRGMSSSARSSGSSGGISSVIASSGAGTEKTAEHLGHLIFLPARLSAMRRLPLHSGQVRETVMTHSIPCEEARTNRVATGTGVN